MAKSRNDILFRFLGDTKSLEKSNRRAQGSLKKTNKAMGIATKAAGAMGLAMGGREIIQQLGNAIGAASDYEESINAVEVSMGTAAQSVIELGDDAANSMGLSKTAVNEAAVAFAAFGEKINTQDVGGTFETFIGRASDFASVMNLEVNDALTKFQSGLAGESEPLRRFGIDVSAAAVELFALENGIIASKSELDEAAKVQARYGLIMEQTTKFAGDFQNTIESTANAQKVLNARLENFQIELGKAIKGPMDDFLTILTRTTGETESVTDGLGKLIDGVRDAGKAMAEADEGGLTGVVNKLGLLREAASDVTKGQLSQLPFIGEEVANAFGHVETALGLAGDTLDDIGPKLSQFASGDLVSLAGKASTAAGSVGGLASALGATEEAISGLSNADIMRGVLNLFDIAASLDRKAALTKAAQTTSQIGGGFQEFHTGGVVPGPTGSTQPIMAKAGERVMTRNQQGGGGDINITIQAGIGDPVAIAEQVQDLLQLYGRTNGTF